MDVTINDKDPDYSPLQGTLDQLQSWKEEEKITINHTRTMVINNAHLYLLSSNAPSKGLGGPLPPPCGAVCQSFWHHGRRPADLETARLHHIQVSLVQDLHATLAQISWMGCTSSSSSRNSCTPPQRGPSLWASHNNNSIHGLRGHAKPTLVVNQAPESSDEVREVPPAPSTPGAHFAFWRASSGPRHWTLRSDDVSKRATLWLISPSHGYYQTASH